MGCQYICYARLPIHSYSPYSLLVTLFLLTLTVSCRSDVQMFRCVSGVVKATYSCVVSPLHHPSTPFDFYPRFPFGPYLDPSLSQPRSGSSFFRRSRRDPSIFLSRFGSPSSLILFVRFLPPVLHRLTDFVLDMYASSCACCACASASFAFPLSLFLIGLPFESTFSSWPDSSEDC